MDRRTLVIIALCLALYLSWGFILKWAGLGQYAGPQRQAPDTSRVARAVTPTPTPGAATSGAGAATMSAPAGADSSALGPERTVLVETPLYRAWFSTRGARLVSVELKHYASAHGAMLGHHRPPRAERRCPKSSGSSCRASPP